MSDYDDVMARLEENGIARREMRVGENLSLVMPERGAHALGPFDAETGESVFWLSPAFADAAAFRELLESGGWNVGGLRLWVAPEIRFGVRDRRRYWETLVVQPDMEPERAAILEGVDGGLETRYDLDLEVFNPGAARKRLSVERSLRAVPNPGAGVPGLDVSGLGYFGFAHHARLTQRERDGTPAEIWNLVQVKGGGEALVPTAGAFDYVDYYEPLEPTHLKADARGARLAQDGRKRYKIGVRSHCHFGRMGNARDLGGIWELIVCNYHNDPTAFYSEQPDRDPDCSGLSMHFYNDGGGFGGFGELEANSPSAGRNGYSDTVETVFTVWGYRGDEARIRRAARAFLGMEPGG